MLKGGISMKIKLGVGALISAAIMGVLGEIGSQVVTQKWEEIADAKGLPKELSFGKKVNESDEEESDES
jgi:hypothetical protein